MNTGTTVRDGGESTAIDRPTGGDDAFRIVLAYDLSDEAERAVAVVADASWPPSTTVRIVTSPSGVGTGLSSFAGLRESRIHEDRVHTTIEAAQQHAATRLAGVATVQTAILAGAPGRAVVEDARTFDAHLIVAGARAQSSLFATLLGSVSTAITEHAHCSVLIARVESLSRVVLATDGSAAAQIAADVVARWPLFAGSQVRVLDVVTPNSPLRYAGSVVSGGPMMDARRGELSAATAHAEATVHSVVDQLRRDRRQATAQVRVGRAADEIAAAAREWPADLVVVGWRGRSLVRRLILGSVARTVLQGVHASVLVVRPATGGQRRSTPKT